MKLKPCFSSITKEERILKADAEVEAKRKQRELERERLRKERELERERTRKERKVIKNPVIEEKVSINKPIKWSMDSQQSYPYWTANMSFTVSIAPLPFNTEQYHNYL